MVKRKEHEKGILEEIPLDLKKMETVTRSPAKSVAQGKLHVVLPFDMEVETLTRLPVKSLMKFLCVSKTWSSLIRSQRFVASYYAAAKPSRFVVAFTNSVFGEPKRLFILSGEETCCSSSSSLVAKLDMTIPLVTLPFNVYKYFSVHGFMACKDGTTFIICNPSTRQFSTFHCKAPCTSLGYDPVHDQFKALTLLTSEIDHIHNPSLTMCKHEVIRLGRGGVVVSRSTQVTSPKERILSFITTPKEVLVWKGFTSLIEYKGKLAVVVPNCLGCASFDRFDLWILEDVTKHEWSRQSFELPLPLPFTLGMGKRMISQGTNKAGEIVFSPAILPGRAQPFYVFYFNPVTNNMRRVRIHGVADTEEFWSRYGLTDVCCVS
ncbi:putative F-box protein [Raphanus sativus]|nr:putative F-box protein [Raphanus sativus]